MPDSWVPPVTDATTHNFTLSKSPESCHVMMGMDCPDLWVRDHNIAFQLSAVKVV